MNDEDRKKLDELHSHFLCPICGMPMVHSRLRGYHCHFEEHNEQCRELERKKIDKILKGRDKGGYI